MTAATPLPARRQLHTPQPPVSSFPYNPGSLLSVMDLDMETISNLLARATALEN
jgi:aspartate carbamoyltransferase catalytic subunit